MSGCPAQQDIPRYLDAVARGDFELAGRVITTTNPFPNVQGMACNHQCQSRCTRINYDKPLMIREVKRFVAEKMAEAASGVPAAQTGKRAAVIGAGPAGLSCARFLAAQGVEVHLYEEKPVPGGMAGDAIPAFRLPGDSLSRDIDAILKLGVRLQKDMPVDAALFGRLAEESDAGPSAFPEKTPPGFWSSFRSSPPCAGASPRASVPTPSSSGRAIPQWTAPVPPDALWGKRHRNHRLPPHPQGNARRRRRNRSRAG